MDANELKQKLVQIEGRSYKTYRQICGAWSFPRFTLFIDHVQSDPFAAPSRLRARVDQAAAGFDVELFDNKVKRVALEDYLARSFAAAINRFVKGHRGTGGSGFVGVDNGGQEILERTAAVINEDYVEIRFVVGLPALGRRCLGREAAAVLLGEVPRLVDESLFYDALDKKMVAAHVAAAEDQEWLRGRLAEMGLAAFVADGSILPRESGVSDRPLANSRVVRFRSPEELKVEVNFPNRGRVTGMGIPEGVTLIIGGGYHGKSTLLKALERGVYSHIPGDGREGVVTRADAVKIRAEDGRRVEKDNISPFISNLPFGVDTAAFSTENASGSTSQAANIVEALEAGSRLLLMDEDTAATNFMIRDEVMQRLISKEKEPITPFIDQVRNLLSEHGVSTILVMGGSGDYFEVADTVIAMENYLPRVVTAEARRLIAARKDKRITEAARFGPLTERVPLAQGLNPRRGRKEKVTAKGLTTIVFGKQTVDLSAVDQLVDYSQTRAIGDLVWYGLRRGYFDGRYTLAQILDRLLDDVERGGLGVISMFREGASDGEAKAKVEAPEGRMITGRAAGGNSKSKAVKAQPAAEAPTAGETHPGDYALPRRFEIAAMLNRMRGLQVK